jgi:hypothetical protein
MKVAVLRGSAFVEAGRQEIKVGGIVRSHCS